MCSENRIIGHALPPQPSVITFSAITFLIHLSQSPPLHPLPCCLVPFPVLSSPSPAVLSRPSCSLLLHLIPNPVVLVPALSTRSLSSRLVLHWHSGVGCHGWVKSVGSPVYFAAVRAFRLKLQAAGLRAYQNKNNLWQCRDPWKEQYRCRSTRVQRLEWIICARKNVLIVFS